MKVIIEIPEEVYNACKDYVAYKCATWSESVIANGLPYEEKKGEWIRVDEDEYKCPYCGYHRHEYHNIYRCEDEFCVHCGADMRGDYD